MASQLELLAQEPQLRAQMGNSGRKRVESEFTIERQIGRIARMYDDLLRSEHAASGKLAENLLVGGKRTKLSNYYVEPASNRESTL